MSSRLTPEQAARVERAVDHVAKLAHKMAHKLPGLSREELRSVGHEALVRAALRYDPAQGVPFVAYAHYRVRGAMIDAARRNQPQVRRHRRALRALEISQTILEEAARHQDPGQNEPRSLHERVQAAADLVAQTTMAVILSRMTPVDPEVLTNQASSDDAERRIDNERLQTRLTDALTKCQPEERSLIDALYVRGVSMHEYAAERGISVSTVSRHHGKLLTKLSQALGRPSKS